MSFDDLFETRLRSALQGATADQDPVPDAADVRRRLAARRRRRAMALSGIAAAIVIGVGVGVAAWPSGDRDVVVPADDTTSSSVTLPTMPTLPDRTDWPGGVVDPATIVSTVERTSSDGVLLQGYWTRDEGFPAGPGDWTPPAECQGRRVQVIVSRDGLASAPIGTGTVVGRPGTVEIGTATFTADQPAANPDATIVRVTLVMVHTDLPLTAVTARFADGHADSTTVDDGHALLGAGLRTVRNTNGDPELTLTQVELTFAAGSDPVVIPANLHGVAGAFDAAGMQQSSITDELNASGECNGPRLPMDGGTLPDDPSAEFAAVNESVRIAFNAGLPLEERAARFTDPALADAVFGEIAAAYPAPSTRSGSRVANVGFRTPTRARIAWDVLLALPIGNERIDGRYTYESVYADLVLDGGTWRLTSESLCSVARTLAPTACAAVDVDGPMVDVEPER